MTQGERVKEIRSTLGLTTEKFGGRLGIQRSAISKIEHERCSLTDANIKAICREFNVDENWLRTGEGNMFRELPEEEETAVIVSDLLEEGRDNPFYEIILEIMNTYRELSPESQEVLRDASAKLLENLQKKKGD